jgi:SSS family solute:Na+ symporter
MMFFGIIAMISYAKDPVAYDSYEKYAYLAFFDLLVPLGNGWHVIVLILVTSLAASSLDSLQNGLNAIFYRDALRAGFDAQKAATVLVIFMNIPAIWLASEKLSVLGLFLVADLVCACGLFPVFLGLQETDKLGGLLPAPTELGAFLGIISGIVTVLINGSINGVNGFQYFWLRNGAICALCGSETMITFIVTPIMAGVMTYVFTHLDILIRGKERARRPIFELAFDKDEEDDVDAKVLEEDVGEKDESPKEEEAAV